MTDNWRPKTGAYVKLSCFSVGHPPKLMNVRLVPIRAVEGGKVYVSGVSNPFARNKHNKFEEQQRQSGITPITLTQYIEPPTAHEARNLPKSKQAGQLYAEQVRMGAVA